MRFTKNITVFTKTIMTMTMSYVRLKRKKFDYKQFKLFNKTDKNLTLDKETKKNFKDVAKQDKNVDKKSLKNIFATNLLH